MLPFISIPRQSMVVLASSAVAQTVTGTTSETTLATVTIPAGIMGLDGALRISSTWSHPGGSGNNKILRCRLGGISGTAFFSTTQTTATSFVDTVRIIQNRNSASSQVCRVAGQGGGGTSTSSITTGSVNTALAQDLVFTGQLASAGESIVLEQWMVELILP